MFDRRLNVAAALFGTGAIVAYWWWTFPLAADDAFISLRYAENVAAGLGPVFNAGERAEGYTCPGWVLLLAVAVRVGLDGMTTAKVLAGLFAAATCALVAASHRFTEAISPPAAALAAVLLATSVAFVQWGACAMEGPLFAGLVWLLTLLYLRLLERPSRGLVVGTAVVGALVALTRINGLLFVAVLGLHRLWVDLRRPPAKPGTSIGLLATFLLIYGSYFAWRWTYYGYALPLTFHAKVGGSVDQLERGLRYVGAASLTSVAVVLPGLVSLARRGSGLERVGVEVGALLVVCHAAFVLLVGGDHFPAHRFFTVLMPPLCVLAATAVTKLQPGWGRNGVATLLVAVNVGSFAYAVGGERVTPKIQWVAKQGQVVGAFFDANAPDDSVIATNAAGAVAYRSRRRVIDTLGLNDVVIAHTVIDTMGQGLAGHEKGNGAYVFERRPDYVLFGTVRGRRKPLYVGDRQLFEARGFRREYVFEVYRLPDRGKLGVYRRRDAPRLGRPLP